MPRPRYVLLRHECDNIRGGSHWDLMLQRGNVLATWALEVLPGDWRPSQEAAGKNNQVSAVRLPDHRLHYLDYEGPISGDRGSVQRVADGEFEWAAWDEAQAEIRFLSGTFAGTAKLEQIEGETWRLSLG